MTIFLDGKGFVSALVEMPGVGMIVLVMPPGMSDGDPAHEIDHRPSAARAQHQVPVAGHQAPAEQLDVDALQRVGEDGDEGLIIARLVKEALAAVAAVDDMIAEVRLDPSQRARHDAGW